MEINQIETILSEFKKDSPLGEVIPAAFIPAILDKIKALESPPIESGRNQTNKIVDKVQEIADKEVTRPKCVRDGVVTPPIESAEKFLNSKVIDLIDNETVPEKWYYERDHVIKLLNKFASQSKQGISEKELGDIMCKYDLEYAEEMGKCIDEILSKLSTKEEWVDVNDQLPMLGRLVLCCNINKTGTENMLCRMDGEEDFYEKGRLKKVTHWKYINPPPPPQQ